MEDFGDLGVGRHAGLRGFTHRVGDLREEVLRVGRVLPVAVEMGDEAVVPVVSCLRYEAPCQKPKGQSEEQARRGHRYHSQREETAGVSKQKKSC